MQDGWQKMKKNKWEIWNRKKEVEEKMRNEYYFEMKYGR